MTDLLQVNNLKVHFHVAEGIIKAVDGISFRVPKGGTVALVGESGSGKSVVSQTIMQILPKVARIESGEILLDDPASDGPPIDIVKLSPTSSRMRQIRGGLISIIFQEPMTSLSPLHTVGDQVGEALQIGLGHRLGREHQQIEPGIALVHQRRQAQVFEQVEPQRHALGRKQMRGGLFKRGKAFGIIGRGKDREPQKSDCSEAVRHALPCPLPADTKHPAIWEGKMQSAQVFSNAPRGNEKPPRRSGAGADVSTGERAD